MKNKQFTNNKAWVKTIKENLVINPEDIVNDKYVIDEPEDDYYEAYNIYDTAYIESKNKQSKKDLFKKHEDAIVEAGKKILKEEDDFDDDEDDFDDEEFEETSIEEVPPRPEPAFDEATLYGDGITVASEDELPPYGKDGEFWKYDWEGLPTNVRCVLCGKPCRRSKTGNKFPKDFRPIGWGGTEGDFDCTAFYDKDIGWTCGQCIRAIAYKTNLKTGIAERDPEIFIDLYDSDKLEPDGSYKCTMMYYEPGTEPSPESPVIEKPNYSDDDDDDLDESINTDEYVTCSWCGEEIPESEASYDPDIGYLCDWCDKGISAHEGPLKYVSKIRRVEESDSSETISSTDDVQKDTLVEKYKYDFPSPPTDLPETEHYKLDWVEAGNEVTYDFIDSDYYFIVVDKETSEFIAFIRGEMESDAIAEHFEIDDVYEPSGGHDKAIIPPDSQTTIENEYIKIYDISDTHETDVYDIDDFDDFVERHTYDDASFDDFKYPDEIKTLFFKVASYIEEDLINKINAWIDNYESAYLYKLDEYPD